MFKSTTSRVSISVLLILPFLVFCSFNLLANLDPQQQVWLNDANQDSIRFKAVNQFFTDYINSEPDAVLESAIFHYGFATKKNAHEEILEAINHKADALRILGRYDEALVELHNLVVSESKQLNTLCHPAYQSSQNPAVVAGNLIYYSRYTNR